MKQRLAWTLGFGKKNESPKPKLTKHESLDIDYRRNGKLTTSATNHAIDSIASPQAPKERNTTFSPTFQPTPNLGHTPTRFSAFSPSHKFSRKTKKLK